MTITIRSETGRIHACVGDITDHVPRCVAEVILNAGNEGTLGRAGVLDRTEVDRRKDDSPFTAMRGDERGKAYGWRGAYC